jgi:sulfur carrier protein
MITVTINGQRREFAHPLPFAELVETLGLAGRRIAVERNGEIVPRSQFARASVADGDTLEIVVAVGGG